jgi:Putative metallopeptidase
LPNQQSSSFQADRISIAYSPPDNAQYQDVYELLRQRNALEKIKEILSPFRLQEQLAIETAACGAVNSYYQRKNFKPTVTICYEFLKRILELLPNQATPSGLTPTDAAVGQFFWVTFHEVGHAAFDMFNVPIFGHEEDAADNFATFITLQFGKGQARRLINGAAWTWTAYLGDYQKNPVVQTRLAAFATDHGLPQERFYNLAWLSVPTARNLPISPVFCHRRGHQIARMNTKRCCAHSVKKFGLISIWNRRGSFWIQTGWDGWKRFLRSELTFRSWPPCLRPPNRLIAGQW